MGRPGKLGTLIRNSSGPENRPRTCDGPGCRVPGPRLTAEAGSGEPYVCRIPASAPDPVVPGSEEPNLDWDNPITDAAMQGKSGYSRASGEGQRGWPSHRSFP